MKREACALLLLLALTACGNGSKDAAAAPAGGVPGGAPGAPGAGRRPPLVLSATDVATVQRGPIEAGIPVSGDLRPIESVVVRARLEGNLERVLVRPGQRVSAGQLLASYEPVLQVSQRSAAEADRASARADLSTAQWNLDQTRELFRAGAVAEREVRVAEQTVAASRARVAAADARIRQTALDVADTRVVAPMTGVVEAQTVFGGERVQRGAELFTVVRNDRLELAGTVPERLAGDVRPGQGVRLRVAGRQVDGKVARVSPTVDPTTRGITVFVEVPNAGGALRGNAFADGRVIGRTVSDAVLVPTTALRQGPAEGGTGGAVTTFVYRLRGTTAERANVNVGLVDEAAGMAEVVDGLAPGDRVIVGNVAAVGRGVTVQVLGGGEKGKP